MMSHSAYLVDKLYTALPIVTASGDFFDISDHELTFQSAAVSQCTEISIEDDTILESDEVFSVQLSTLDQDVFLTLSMATVTIEDNDSELCNLSHYLLSVTLFSFIQMLLLAFNSLPMRSVKN